MGGDIAEIFLRGGWQVHVQEPADRMRSALASRFKRRIGLHETLDSIPWREIVLVIEAVPEKLALKQRVFAEIEKRATRTAILTTNSSSLQLGAVTKKLLHKDRAAAAHWLTPAHVAPIVEVVKGDNTSPATIRKINAWLRELGKLPINLSRDVPGMLVNRVQHAMMREAFDLIDRGIVTPEDVDAAVRFGFGFRYVACGPIRQRDLNGLVIHMQSAAQIYPTLHNGKKPARVLADRVRSGRTGLREGSGFYDWDPKTASREIKRYEALWAKALKLMGG